MSLIDSLRRIVAEDAVKRVSDPKPLFAAAGAADLAFAFVRTVPERLEKVADSVREEWTPERFGDAFSELVEGANVDDVRARAEHLRDQVAATLKERRDAVVDDLADLSADARELPTQLRTRARQAPGRAVVELANQVGAAYEAYDTCVDRGRIVVARLRGDATPGNTPSPDNRRLATPPASQPGTAPITPVTRPRPPVSPSTVESTPPVRRAATRRAAATPDLAVPAGAATTGSIDAAAPIKRAAAKRAARKTAAPGATPAKTAPAKTAPAKTTPAKTAPAKTAATKTAATTTAAATTGAATTGAARRPSRRAGGSTPPTV